MVDQHHPGALFRVHTRPGEVVHLSSNRDLVTPLSFETCPGFTQVSTILVLSKQATAGHMVD